MSHDVGCRAVALRNNRWKGLRSTARALRLLRVSVSPPFVGLLWLAANLHPTPQDIARWARTDETVNAANPPDVPPDRARPVGKAECAAPAFARAEGFSALHLLFTT